MASTTMKQTCIKCSKGAGTATCNGCQQSFCIKHFTEHRQEISEQMDYIGQEHDLLRRDMNLETNTHSLLIRIDQWEQDTTKKIQVIAQQARLDVQKLIETTKNELSRSVNRLTEELRHCRESDDYTEIDIKKWNEQLKALRQIIANPPSININLENNTTSIIPIIKVTASQRPLASFNQDIRSNENNYRISEQSIVHSKEIFVEAYGNISLSTDGLLGGNTNSRGEGSCVSGIGRYSSQINHIRFRIEKKNSNYLFFGIITASQKLMATISNVQSAYGWWDLGYTIANGKVKDRSQKKTLDSGDEITLILDCNNRNIQLKHDRTDAVDNIPIDLEQCPFPWKIVIRLDSQGDCVRILH